MRILVDTNWSPLEGAFSMASLRSLLESEASVQDQESFSGTWNNAVGICIAFVVSGLANSVGIGGGLFWVPLFNALLGFSVRFSASMSQACVACGTIGATAYSILLRHPFKYSRPLIEYPLASVLMPALVMGVAIGVLLNIIVPQLILSIILFIILVGVALRTFYVGLRQHRQEKAAKLGHAQSMSSNPGAMFKTLQRSKSSFKDFSGVYHKPVIAWVYLFELVLLAAIFLAFQIGKSQYNRCTWQYGVLFAVQAMMMVTWSTWSVLKRAHPLPVLQPEEANVDGEELESGSLERQNSINNEAIHGESGNNEITDVLVGDVSALKTAIDDAKHISNSEQSSPGSSSPRQKKEQLPKSMSEKKAPKKKFPPTLEGAAWQPKKLLLIWAIVLVIGVLAGMVGLGGGVLIAPLMMELDVHPQAAAATSTLIVFFSSTIATVTFALYGRINFSYFAVYGPVCLVGGLVGVFVLSGIVRRWKMASVVTFTLGALVVVSAGLVAAFAGRHAVEDLVNGGGLEAGDFCTS